MFERARPIFQAAVEAVDPGGLVRSRVRREGPRIAIGNRDFDLEAFDRVILLAFGKAAPAMGEALAERLGDGLAEGLVVSPEEPPAGSGGRLSFVRAAHPLPDEGSLEGARRALTLAGEAGPRDLLFVCVSGGGSSLLCLPASGLSLRDKREITGQLLRAGAGIGEMNVVRKHLSAVKGGRLAGAARPATVVNLVISDVPGNDLADIASGPTHPDDSTFAGAEKILRRYDLWSSAPPAVRDHLDRGRRGETEETLKRDHPAFKRVRSFLLGDNAAALRAAAAEAERLGFEARILPGPDSGEARRAAVDFIGLAEREAVGLVGRRKPICLVGGGELTVTVRGKGRGGRNQEFVLAAVIEIGDRLARPATPTLFRSKDWLVLSLGTDGIDGSTDAAGAWADSGIFRRIADLGLDARAYLDDNDSYGFFLKTGHLLRTGPTGTNVMDIRLFLLGGRDPDS